MVLSSSSRSASISSITAQYSGGGGKKAGGAPKSTSTAGLIAFRVRGVPQPLSFMKMPLVSTTRASRGIGWRFSQK